MTVLRIAADLTLPLDWMVMATVVYGARGSGKTTLGRVVAEELVAAGQRFVAVDLKGDWYGLKSTADGAGAGIPVVIFGGEHADLPLADGSGAIIGEIIATHDQSFVVDLEHLSKGRQVRWLKDFFLALYHHNRRPLMVLADEIQRYAPQRPMSPDETICLGAVEDVIKLGRKHGLGILALTQRGAGLNKEVSELCDVLVALRTPGPLDQDRIKDWLDANTTRAHRDQVMGQLAKLPTGTAIVASGHPDIDVFATVAIRRAETFDSSATPKVGQTIVTPRVLADVDLEAIRARLGKTPPSETSTTPASSAELEALRAERAALIDERDGLLAEMEALHSEKERRGQALAYIVSTASDAKIGLQGHAIWAGLIGSMASDALALTDGPSSLPTRERVDGSEGAEARNGAGAPPAPVLARVAASQPWLGESPSPSQGAPTRTRSNTFPNNSQGRSPQSSPTENNAAVSAVEQRILDALATLAALGEPAPSRAAVAGISGYRQSGTWNSAVSRLQASGRIAFPEPGALALTEDGRSLAAPLDIRALPALHDAWRARLNPLQRKLFDAVVALGPERMMARGALATGLGYQQSGTFNSAVAYLERIGAVTYPRPGYVAPAAILFPPGLPS